MNYGRNLLGREVKIGDKEGEITDVLGTEYLEVSFFDINVGKTSIHFKDIEKYLVPDFKEIPKEYKYYIHEELENGNVRLLANVGMDIELTNKEFKRLFRRNSDVGHLVQEWIEKGYADTTRNGDSYLVDKNMDLGDRLYFDLKPAQVTLMNSEKDKEKNFIEDDNFNVLDKLVHIEECGYSGIGGCIMEAIDEPDNDLRSIGKDLHLILSESQENPEMRKGIEKALIAITGYDLSTITRRLKEIYSKELNILKEKNQSVLDEMIHKAAGKVNKQTGTGKDKDVQLERK